MSDHETTSDERTASKAIGVLLYLALVGLAWFPISWVRHQWGIDGLRTMLMVLGPASIAGLVVLAWQEHGPRRMTGRRSRR